MVPRPLAPDRETERGLNGAAAGIAKQRDLWYNKHIGSNDAPTNQIEDIDMNAFEWRRDAMAAGNILAHAIGSRSHGFDVNEEMSGVWVAVNTSGEDESTIMYTVRVARCIDGYTVLLSDGLGHILHRAGDIEELSSAVDLLYCRFGG